MKAQVKITHVGSWYGMEWVDEEGNYLSRVLDRDLRPHLWKTLKGAVNYAKRNGYEII